MDLPFDLDDPSALVTIVILGALLMGALAYLGRMRGAGIGPGLTPARWNDAVRTVASEMGLEHEPVPTAYDGARGSIGAQSISIGYGSAETFSGIGMELLVRSSGLPDRLAIRGVDALWHRRVGELGARQKLGDPDFDARVAMHGAPERLFQILRDDAELRARIVHATADLGATLVDREIGLRRGRFAASADELRACLVPMIELAQSLERPRPPGLPRGVGTAMAVALRRAERLKDGRKTHALAVALAPLASRLGFAVEPREDEVGVSLRGEIEGRRAAITIDWGLTVKITVTAKGMRDGLRLYTDRTPFDTAADEPPKAEHDPSVPDYVGEGVYVEGRRARREEMRAAFDALPGALREALVGELPRHHVRYFRLQRDEVWLMLWPDVDELLDPEQDLEAALRLAVRAAAIQIRDRDS